MLMPNFSARSVAIGLGLVLCGCSSGNAADVFTGTMSEAQFRAQNARLGLIPVPWPRKMIDPTARPAVTTHPARSPNRHVQSAPAKSKKVAATPVTVSAPITEPVKVASRPETSVKEVPVVTVIPHVAPAVPALIPSMPNGIATLPAGAPTAADNARARAAELLIGGQILTARRVLSDKAVAQDPVVIATLGQTYDPLVLAAFPNLKSAANADRARELYALAIARGNGDAKQRLMALEASRKK